MARRTPDQLLAAVPLFEGLAKKELRWILKEADEERFPPGRSIVTEGKPGGRFYLILEGVAKVIVDGRTRARLGPGEFFGEISIIDRRPRSATVHAETEVRTLSIASWNFLTILEENFSITRKVMQQLCERIREHERSLIH